ncbi:MAG: hypothetical protein P4L71_13270 [Acetobacteraceae bacterium]|nr:hypothetical protein [Acetobacteraceae bacterium]
MPTIDSSRVFATGANGATQPDSITIGNGVLWAEYGNGADSTGAGGSSTIVEYSLSGQVEHSYSIAGSVDGLKIDPKTGMVFALQNQDGNSTLSLINPKTGKVSSPLSYGVTSATHGYDDVAFLNGSVYLSYTNPTGSGDPVVQKLTNGDQPIGTLVTSNILADGATGTNIATGQTNQPIPLSDPDSLKTTPNGGLVLTSGADYTIVLISDPGTAAQSERFVQLTNLPTGSALDDVIIPTSSTGTFYVSNAGTDQIEAYKVSGLNKSDAYASVGTEIVQVDLQTGAETPVITGLSASHGMGFVPASVNMPVVQSTSIFAIGAEAGGATQPDSVTMGDGSVWIEYGNGADSTGKLPNGGSSTIVQYDMQGQIEHTYSLPGTIDGLKYDPVSKLVFALKNQDANSQLYLINPATNQVSGPLSYGSPYVYGANSARGYDDVAFDHGKVFLSATNPTTLGDPIIQILDNGNDPSGTLQTTTILRLGDTGTNLTTGQVNQPLPVADPDSLKTLANDSLILTSDHDASLTIIAHPGTAQQTESFVTLPAGSSGLDDAIVPTSTSGTFVISNLGANDVLKVNVTGLNTNDIYVAVGSDNAIDQLDPTTGALTPVITGLNSPHGMTFIPSAGSSLISQATTPSLSDILGKASGASGLSAADFPVPGAASGSSSSGSGTIADQSFGGPMAMVHHLTTAHGVMPPTQHV